MANVDLDYARQAQLTDPDIPDTCIKCSEEKGTLFHCVWGCSKLNQYLESSYSDCIWDCWCSGPVSGKNVCIRYTS